MSISGTAGASDGSPQRARWAVAAMFFANGFVVGSWAPQIPALVARQGLSETTLGLLILGFGLGALIAMPACGYAMARYSSDTVLRAIGIACAFGLMLVALSPGLATVAIALILFGGTIGGMDVAMNTNAVAVEKRLGRAIMSSSHGFWSLGGFAGAALGGLILEASGHLVHAGIVTVLTFAMVALAQRYLLREPKVVEQTDARKSFPTNPLLYLLGLLALFAMIPEGAVLDWAALYLRQELGADIATASFAFALFSATMAVMRFSGDLIRQRLGAVRTLRVSSLIAAAGLLAAAFAPTGALAIAAFAFAGLGIANIVPIIFSAAGNQEGMATGTGMSVVTTMGYSGILVAPSAIGFIAQATGFTLVFAVLAGLLVIVFAAAGFAHRAEYEPPTQ